MKPSYETLQFGEGGHFGFPEKSLCSNNYSHTKNNRKERMKENAHSQISL